MRDPRLAELLGQDALANWLLECLERPDARLVRLSGSAGSGKSYVARLVAKEWRDKRGTCVVSVGDSEHSWRALYPLLSGLANAHRDWIGLANTGTRSVVGVADSAAGGAGVGTSIFDLLTAAFRQQTERALKPYTSLERDIVLDLKRLARSRRLLLIAENAHWWDADSLRLLGDVLADPLRETIPQLSSVVVLLVDTAEEQTVAAPDAFHALAALAAEKTGRASRCTREQFPEVLKAFGAAGDLPDDVLADLFGATHGHLKLAEQIAAYERQVHEGAAPISIDADYLSSLIAERLASLGSLSPEVTDLLASAAILGLSCTEQDLKCIAEKQGPDLRALVERAERIGFVERLAKQIVFSHDVIRSAILSGQTTPRLETLYLKLAECLSILRPGDYEARAQALMQGGDGESAREMVALAAVAQIRRGVPGAKVVVQTALQFPDDPPLTAYVELVAKGYAAIASGDFRAAPANLRTPIAMETTAMAAERNYLAALCCLRSQTRAGADEARTTLSSWGLALSDEVELGLRFLVLLQQAQVLGEMFDDARATEMLIEQRLSSRSHFDADAAVMVEVQNRRAAAVMAPEIAEDRISQAVSFFRRGTDKPGRDQLELFRALTNLAAIQIRLDKNADAYAHALEAERVAVQSLDVGHRLDVLASNIVLAGYRSGAIDVDQAIANQTLIVHSPEGAKDNFLQRCNLTAYLLLGSRDEAAAGELEILGDQVDSNRIDETYLVYYWTALSVAAAALRGNAEEALRMHRSMDDFVNALKWPTASYIARRQQLLTELLPGLPGELDRTAADRLIIEAKPMQIGSAWAYYARLVPCCELSFWSDS